jgi:hypothetical protein
MGGMSGEWEIDTIMIRNLQTLFEKRDKSESSIEMDLTEILSQGLEWIE